MKLESENDFMTCSVRHSFFLDRLHLMFVSMFFYKCNSRDRRNRKFAADLISLVYFQPQEYSCVVLCAAFLCFSRCAVDCALVYCFCFVVLTPRIDRAVLSALPGCGSSTACVGVLLLHCSRFVASHAAANDHFNPKLLPRCFHDFTTR